MLKEKLSTDFTLKTNKYDIFDNYQSNPGTQTQEIKRKMVLDQNKRDFQVLLSTSLRSYFD